MHSRRNKPKAVWQLRGNAGCLLPRLMQAAREHCAHAEVQPSKCPGMPGLLPLQQRKPLSAVSAVDLHCIVVATQSPRGKAPHKTEASQGPACSESSGVALCFPPSSPLPFPPLPCSLAGHTLSNTLPSVGKENCSEAWPQFVIAAL